MQKAEQILQAIRGSGEPDDAKVSSPVRRGVCGKVSAKTTRHFPTLHQFISHEYYTGTSVENSSSALGDRNRIALSSRCDLQRRCDSNDDWTHRPCDGIHQQSGHCPCSTSQISKCRSSQTLVCRSSIRCFFTTYHALFSFLRKPYIGKHGFSRERSKVVSLRGVKRNRLVSKNPKSC